MHDGLLPKHVQGHMTPLSFSQIRNNLSQKWYKIVTEELTGKLYVACRMLPILLTFDDLVSQKQTSRFCEAGFYGLHTVTVAHPTALRHLQ